MNDDAAEVTPKDPAWLSFSEKIAQLQAQISHATREAAESREEAARLRQEALFRSASGRRNSISYGGHISLHHAGSAVGETSPPSSSDSRGVRHHADAACSPIQPSSPVASDGHWPQPGPPANTAHVTNAQTTTAYDDQHSSMPPSNQNHRLRSSTDADSSSHAALQVACPLLGTRTATSGPFPDLAPFSDDMQPPSGRLSPMHTAASNPSLNAAWDLHARGDSVGVSLPGSSLPPSVHTAWPNSVVQSSPSRHSRSSHASGQGAAADCAAEHAAQEQARLLSRIAYQDAVIQAYVQHVKKIERNVYCHLSEVDVAGERTVTGKDSQVLQELLLQLQHDPKYDLPYTYRQSRADTPTCMSTPPHRSARPSSSSNLHAQQQQHNATDSPHGRRSFSHQSAAQLSPSQKQQQSPACSFGTSPEGSQQCLPALLQGHTAAAHGLAVAAEETNLQLQRYKSAFRMEQQSNAALQHKLLEQQTVWDRERAELRYELNRLHASPLPHLLEAKRMRHSLLLPLAQERDGWRRRCEGVEALCSALAQRLGKLLGVNQAALPDGSHVDAGSAMASAAGQVQGAKLPIHSASTPAQSATAARPAEGMNSTPAAASDEVTDAQVAALRLHLNVLSSGADGSPDRPCISVHIHVRSAHASCAEQLVLLDTRQHLEQSAPLNTRQLVSADQLQEASVSTCNIAHMRIEPQHNLGPGSASGSVSGVHAPSSPSLQPMRRRESLAMAQLHAALAAAHHHSDGDGAALLTSSNWAQAHGSHETFRMQQRHQQELLDLGHNLHKAQPQQHRPPSVCGADDPDVTAMDTSSCSPFQPYTGLAGEPRMPHQAHLTACRQRAYNPGTESPADGSAALFSSSDTCRNAVAQRSEGAHEGQQEEGNCGGGAVADQDAEADSEEHDDDLQEVSPRVLLQMIGFLREQLELSTFEILELSKRVDELSSTGRNLQHGLSQKDQALERLALSESDMLLDTRRQLEAEAAMRCRLQAQCDELQRRLLSGLPEWPIQRPNTPPTLRTLPRLRPLPGTPSGSAPSTVSKSDYASPQRQRRPSSASLSGSPSVAHSGDASSQASRPRRSIGGAGGGSSSALLLPLMLGEAAVTSAGKAVMPAAHSRLFASWNDLASAEGMTADGKSTHGSSHASAHRAKRQLQTASPAAVRGGDAAQLEGH